MIINRSLSLITITFVAMIAGATVDADTTQRPCRDDVKKFCGHLKPGAGRISQCLKEHEAEITPACREARQAVEKRLTQFDQACRSDVEKYCKGVVAGRGRGLSCLKGRESDLTEACRAEFKRSKADMGQAQ